MTRDGERTRDDRGTELGSERRRAEDLPPRDALPHGGWFVGDGHHRPRPGGGARERRPRRRLLRLLAAHHLLRPRQRVRARLSRGLLRAPAAARADRALLRPRRLGPPDGERLRGGHGGLERALALHVDADGAGRRVDPGPRRRPVPRSLATRALPRARSGAGSPVARARRRRLSAWRRSRTFSSTG